MNWVKQTSKGPSQLYDLLRERQVEIITEQRILKSLEARGIDVSAQGKAGASKDDDVVMQDTTPKAAGKLLHGVEVLLLLLLPALARTLVLVLVLVLWFVYPSWCWCCFAAHSRHLPCPFSPVA
jgi:hypothetical protein